jgi:hypothetical protein
VTVIKAKRPLHIFEAKSADELQEKMKPLLDALPITVVDLSVKVTSPTPDRWIGTVTYKLPQVNVI